MNVAELPFNQYLGLRTSDDGQGVLLTPQPHHLNHVQTLHATVLFGLAEAAAGHAVLQRFPELSDGFIAVLRGSSVKYRQPGQMSISCAAFAVIDEAKADNFSSQLRSRGRAIIDVTVKVTQNEKSLLTGTFTWFASRIA